jgi:hypothetical protein
MQVAEVTKILGDPEVRAAGLDGRGYDDKLLYRLSGDWRVTVLASRGRAIAFLPAPAPKKSSNELLQKKDSVIP